ncbi:5-hydroxytryptamine receptor 3A-like isoform X2 [Notolabrus celidotus]|uniref:5-hydroxytryptamine receptor 3A-like isoform X2 n=1 Tax=Notolabrus celidotus TaxID=1203425 RepID=UPI00148FCE73|nr:5-hydroxytryptamine receptor 3A-like isoform X2 [Notolabrus celidotus]
MVFLRVFTLLSFIGVLSSQTPDCSYLGLLTNLTLTPASETLQIMRPVKNWTTPTEVRLDMVMYGILHVDEKSQTVESHIWTQMTWRNEFLTWNPADFCGIKRLNVPRSKMWLPDISIQEDTSDTSTTFYGPLVYLDHTGLVIGNSRQRLTSTCRLNLAMFPFDSQNCTMTFVSMSSDAEQMSLGSLTNDTLLSKLSEQIMVTNGEWELDHLEIGYKLFAKDGVHQDMLVYTITISRKPLLYVINLIVPLLYLLVLDLASFFISEGRGEKLSFKVTILLSISVLLLILQDMLPSTESSMPYIAIYCVVIFAVVGLSVLEAMVVSFLIDLDGYCATMAPSPDDSQDEIELEDGYHKEPTGAEEEGQVKQGKSFPPMVGPNCLAPLESILKEVKAARLGVKKQREEEKKEGRYKRIAGIIDHIFFFLYFSTVVVFLSYMNIMWLCNLYK